MPQRNNGLTKIGDLLADIMPEIPAEKEQATKRQRKPRPVTKRSLKRSERVLAVRDDRENERQRIGYLARPFILCGLPFKKPKKGATYYRRENGDEVLEITASPQYGLPFGMDLEVLIWVSTLAAHAKQKNGGKIPRVLEFESGADFLKAFNLPLDGPSYRRAQDRFLRVFYATWFFGRKNGPRAKMFKVSFFDAIDLWFSEDDLHTQALPGDDFKNKIVLSEAFANDLELHLLPVDLNAIAAWSDKPSQVYFFMWLNWRCYTARGRCEIPLIGLAGIKEQCGFDGYNGKQGALDFRGKIRELLDGAKVAWPDCPVDLVTDNHERGDHLVIERKANAIHERKAKASI